MARYRFQIVNVFAEAPFAGNPLAVIEDGHGLSDAQMLALARQFNLSETTFLLPSNHAAARVRIFTPSYEMEFAGHPTLGSAHVLRELRQLDDSFSLEMLAGVIPVQGQGDRWRLSANAPRLLPCPASAEQLAAMLGQPADVIAGAPLWVNCGNEQLLIPLRDADAVHTCHPDAALLRQYGVDRDGNVKVYVFARDEHGFVARFFWQHFGQLMEDPGTGSACANLGGWWLASGGELPLHTQVVQGHALERLNHLSLDVGADRQIQVGGRVVPLMRGEITL